MPPFAGASRWFGPWRRAPRHAGRMNREGDARAGGGDAAFAGDALSVQQWRVRDAVLAVELLRGALVSTASEMRWRSPTAERFHRRAEIQVASLDGLLLALGELDGGLHRARQRLAAAGSAAG